MLLPMSVTILITSAMSFASLNCWCFYILGNE